MQKRTLITWMGVLLFLAVGCRQNTAEMTYPEALRQARTSIYKAVQADGSLRQTELNAASRIAAEPAEPEAASSIAVELAETEAEYWSQRLVEKNLSFPDWHERCIELEKRPVWCEGGSMEPLERNSMLYMFLDETITAMKKTYNRR